MIVSPRLRIVKVAVNSRRHLITYYFSGGNQLTIYFVGNIRSAWQSPLYQYCHSAWLCSEGGTRLLGGILHDPVKTAPSSDCYFYSAGELTREELLRYLTIVLRNSERTWRGWKKLVWLNVSIALEGPRHYCKILGHGKVPDLPVELVSSSLPHIV